MTKKTAAEKAVPAVTKPRAVRTTATRVTSARHSKPAASSDSVVIASPVVIDTPQENPSEAIAKIAYGYWEARGYQGGDATEDWFRAEAEYRQR